GIRILNNIDDWLILAKTEQIAVQHRDVVLAHMRELGLRLNAKKKTTYLGVVWDSTTMQARLSPARIELFTSWCGIRQLDPVHCPVGTVLEFLQARFATGLTHSTLKVYMAAIAVFHSPLGGQSAEVSHRTLTLKAVFLLAISSLKRVGDLQVLSVAPSHLDFAPGMAKAFVYPRPGYIPKVPASVPWPIELQAFCPPPFQDQEQQRLNLLCP
ncbi:hypothetical protein M9458_045048, partial [Cirrhinus mrigala]